MSRRAGPDRNSPGLPGCTSSAAEPVSATRLGSIRLLTTDGRIVFRAMYGAYHGLFNAVRRAGTAIFARRVQPPRAVLLARTLAGVIVGPRP